MIGMKVRNNLMAPDPHHPMTPPGKWFDMYKPEDMPLPDSRFDDLNDAPSHLKLFSLT